MSEDTMNQGTLFVAPAFRRVEQGKQSSVWVGPRLVLSYVLLPIISPTDRDLKPRMT